MYEDRSLAMLKESAIKQEQAAILSVVEEHNSQLAVLHDLADGLFLKFAPVLGAQIEETSMAGEQAYSARGSSELYRQLEDQTYSTNGIAEKLRALRRLAEV